MHLFCLRTTKFISAFIILAFLKKLNFPSKDLWHHIKKNIQMHLKQRFCRNVLILKLWHHLSTRHYRVSHDQNYQKNYIGEEMPKLILENTLWAKPISALVTKIKADKFCFEQKNELMRTYRVASLECTWVHSEKDTLKIKYHLVGSTITYKQKNLRYPFMK